MCCEAKPGPNIDVESTRLGVVVVVDGIGQQVLLVYKRIPTLVSLMDYKREWGTGLRLDSGFGSVEGCMTLRPPCMREAWRFRIRDIPVGGADTDPPSLATMVMALVTSWAANSNANASERAKTSVRTKLDWGMRKMKSSMVQLPSAPSTFLDWALCPTAPLASSWVTARMPLWSGSRRRRRCRMG